MTLQERMLVLLRREGKDWVMDGWFDQSARLRNDGMKWFHYGITVVFRSIFIYFTKYRASHHVPL